jgi:hypothetical protein
MSTGNQLPPEAIQKLAMEVAKQTLAKRLGEKSRAKDILTSPALQVKLFFQVFDAYLAEFESQNQEREETEKPWFLF